MSVKFRYSNCMTELTLRVNERAFNNLGIQVGFDEGLYGELVDELAEAADHQVPEGWAPIVTVNPAEEWGMSGWRQTVSQLGSNRIYPRCEYDPETRTVALKAAKSQDLTNELLIFGTRRWSGHLTGELRADTIDTIRIAMLEESLI
jgi:hypothetical protein